MDHVAKNDKVADAPSGSLVYRLLPISLWPIAQLARWDRPIGWQLLLWPCLWAAAMAANANKGIEGNITILVVHSALFTIGAIAMRGAGCTYNDLVDHELDAKVERTRSRPLPAGRISRKSAKLFIVAQLFVGALVLIQFNWFTILLSISSLFIVAIYPFAKRFTDWPQLFLGMAFSWGALVGWSALFGEVNSASMALYVAAVCWTIGYDTIYAHQDKDDDALIGVRSTARLFAENTKKWLLLFFTLTAVFMTLAFYLSSMPAVAFAGIAISALMFLWQINKLDINNPAQCLALFKFNGHVGIIITAVLILALLVA